MKKYIFVTILLVCSNIITYFCSAYTWIWSKDVYPNGETATFATPYVFNTYDAYITEKRIANGMFEIAHIYWEHLDKEYDRDGNVIARHNYWDDVISETDSYLTVDSLLEHDWEDFYCDWDSDNLFPTDNPEGNPD